MNITINAPRLVPALALGLLAAAGLVVAGPLTPPPGPVSSTMKTLSEVEPRIPVNAVNTPGNADATYCITSPGSYYLTDNLSLNLRHGIQILTSGVTLDLNGFQIDDSFPNTGPVRYGVYVNATGCTVRNGSFVLIRGYGLYCDGSSANFDLLNISNCRNGGMYSYANGSVSRCIARHCGGTGISVSRASVSDCTSEGNTGDGFFLNSSSVASRCIARGNTANGFEILGGSASDCSSDGNSYGFNIGGASVINCSATENNSGGIRATAGCIIRGNYVDTPLAFSNILLTSEDNRVDGNTCHRGLFGVQITNNASDNLIVGNFFTGPANAALSLGGGSNQVGPIVSASGTITSTSPWANFAR